MKVSNLLGAKLDFFVAKANGDFPSPLDHKRYYILDYSSDWSEGGKIIEREHIKLKAGTFEKWKADLKVPYHKYSMEGPTALIAAMRAFVASRFGTEVDDS